MNNIKLFAVLSACMTACLGCGLMYAALPGAAIYNVRQCEGSLTPYPAKIESVSYPDSLIPKYISHVGRHGSRYPASSTNAVKLKEALEHAKELGTITSQGLELLDLTERVIDVSTNRWGALDSLGQAEQRAIATRMVKTFSPVFSDGSVVSAICSYSPRCMMSMFSFIHQMDRLNNKLEYTATAGRKYSYLMRPFDTDAEYIDFYKSDIWKTPYEEYLEEVCPVSAIIKVLGRDYPFGDTAHARELALLEYYLLAGLQAMEMPSEMSRYFTADEMNALWSCFNLRQYLQRTASTVSQTPADIATALLLDIISETDRAIEGVNPAVANLRFGHAETLMPLLSLMRLDGCYYLTNYFDTVNQHWLDFNVTPMAANLQLILFQNSSNGRWYVRIDHNEKPVKLLSGDDRIYIPWGEARRYLMNCIPFYAQ